MNNTNQGTGAGMDVLAVMDATANECGLHDNDKLLPNLRKVTA